MLGLVWHGLLVGRGPLLASKQRVGRNKPPPALPELWSLERLRRSGTDFPDLVPAYVNRSD